MPHRVLAIHKGGSNGIRGTEVCLVEVLRALRGSGASIAFARNLPVVDHLVPSERTITLDFPEMLVGGSASRFAVGRYLRSLATLRDLVRLFRPTVIYASGGLPCQLAIPLRWVTGIPVICHLHHPATRRYFKAWLVRHADAVIFPSEFTRSAVRGAVGIDGRVVYNGIDTETLVPVQRDTEVRRSLGIPDSSVVVGQVGALVAHKRAGMLLEAIAASGDKRLFACIVGRGPLERELRGLAERLGIQHQTLITGGVPDVRPYYQHVFDINCLLSREEGLGISILEGSSCGLPAVGSDCTGLSETIVDGETGLLCDPESLDAFVMAITSLAADREVRTRMGMAGRSLVRRRFAIERYHASIVEEFDRVAPSA